MKEFTVWGHKNVRLEPLTIEAETQEEAFEEYARRVNLGQVEIDSPQWYTFSEGDCNLTFKA